MRRINKIYIFMAMVIGTSFVLATSAIPEITERYNQKKKRKLELEEYEKSIPVIYEQQLFTNTELQQQVNDLSLPDNILELFKRHEKQLNSFAELCYQNRKEQVTFFVEYINEERFYFSTADSVNGNTIISEETAIKKGEFDYITTFMDYAIDSDLVFRDWMLSIITPNPVYDDMYIEKRTNNHGALLSITIYDGNGLEVALNYSPYVDVDYTDEYYGVAPCGPLGGTKMVRINPHWYYQYAIRGGSESFWCPDPETLGFSIGGIREDAAAEIEEIEIAHTYKRRLSPIQVALIYAVKFGAPILAVSLIFILIRRFNRRKRSTK